MKLQKDIREFIELLLSRRVEFLLVAANGVPEGFVAVGSQPD